MSIKTNSAKNQFLIFFKRSFYILVLTLGVESCIPTKKITYLENFDGNAKEVYTPQELEYKIQVGDRFFIKVIDSYESVSLIESQPSSQSTIAQNLINQAPSVHDFEVNEKGEVSLPLIGDIVAAGKTIQEFKADVIKACKGVISQPSLKLYMTNYNVTLLGEFRTPGFYQLITNQPTLFDAIGLAGDLTDFADRKNVKIIRKVEGKIEINYVDITDPQFAQSPFYYVRPNDVIHVMPLKVKKYSSNNAIPLALSILTTIITVISVTSR